MAFQFIKKMTDQIRPLVHSSRHPLDNIVPSLGRFLTVNWLHPIQVASRIEAQSPWAARQFLNLANPVLEPYVRGLGVKIQRLSNDRVEVVLPWRLRDKIESRPVGSAALVATGEYAVRLFWIRHLDLGMASLHIRDVNLHLLNPASEQICVRVEVPESECEQMLFELRKSGQVTSSTQALVFDEKEKLVAEIKVQIQCHLQKQVQGASRL